MKGRMRPYLPELTIRDYNTYMRYLRGVRRQMYKSYGFYACHLLRTNGVLFAILSDSLAGRMPTCKRQRMPGTPFQRSMMCQTLGIRQAAQTEILMGWHNLQDRKYSELRPVKRLRRAADKLLLRRAYEKARQENPALERLFAQEREQAVVQMNLSAKNYALAAEPMSNVYGALYSTLATDDPNQRKSMRYIGSCIGRIFYLLDKAERFEADRRNGQYNVFVVNELNGQAAAIENARRQALAAVNDLMRAYKMLDLKLNDTLLNNIMILGLQHAVYPLEQDVDTENGRSHEEAKSKSWSMAYCGMAAALCVALMLLGTIIPIAMFIAPAVASFLIATVCMECGITMAWTAYAAVSLLGLLFVPDKEIALIFTVLLGYYPLVKPKFDRIRPRALQLVCKLLLCNAAVLAMYGLLLVIVPAGSVSQELRTTALAMTLLTLAMGNVAFALYDRALCNMLLLYKLKWQPKLHKMLGMH